MNRRAALVIALLLAATGLAVAPASAAGAFTVTLASSRSVADVGQVTVLTGKVSGAGAAKKLVAVDARIGSGAWKRLGTTRTTKKGTFSYKATITTAGTVAYRVVAPRTKKVAAGTSKTVTLATWRWLDLYDQPYLVSGGVVTRGASPGSTIGGAKIPARTLGLGQGAYVQWNLSQQCDRVLAQVGLTDSDQGSTRAVRFQSGVDVTDIAVTGGQPLKSFSNLSASPAHSFGVSRPDGLYAYLVQPRAHCKVNTLPVAVD